MLFNMNLYNHVCVNHRVSWPCRTLTAGSGTIRLGRTAPWVLAMLQLPAVPSHITSAMVVTWRTPHLGALEPDEKCMVQKSQQTNALLYLCAKSKGAQESGELKLPCGHAWCGQKQAQLRAWQCGNKWMEPAVRWISALMITAPSGGAKSGNGATASVHPNTTAAWGWEITRDPPWTKSCSFPHHDKKHFHHKEKTATSFGEASKYSQAAFDANLSMRNYQRTVKMALDVLLI